MSQQEIIVEKMHNNSNDGDTSNEVFADIGISIFLALGIYAEYDLYLKIQMPIEFLISVFFGFFIVLSLALIFIKAGEAGWKAFIPVYNIITYLKIVGKPAWWTLLFFIPPINIVVAIWMTNILSVRFGKDKGFTAGLLILPWIYYPILAYGEDNVVIVGEKEQIIPTKKPKLVDIPDRIEKATDTSSAISDEDATFLKAEPISRKRMDLLWLDPPHLAQLEQPLTQHKVITVNMGSTDSNVRDYEITQEDFKWAKQIERIVDKAFSAGQRENYNKSIRYYKEALLLAPGCDLFLMSIGVGYAQIGQKAKGLRYLKRAAKISPDNTRIHENLDKMIGKKQSAENQPKKDLPVSGGHVEADKPLHCPKCGDMKRETTPRYGTFVCNKCGAVVLLDDYNVSI